MGLYIHVPFCHAKCPYCDFYSVLGARWRAGYVEALCWELELARPLLPLPVQSVYLGGGTPSVLSLDELGRIIAAVRRSYAPYGLPEVTLECNPEDGTVDYLRGLRELGVNRLSVGVQATDDALLRYLGRRHTVVQSRAVVEEAQSAGFRNISADLIYGLPAMGAGAVYESVREVLSWGVQHLSAYHLQLEEGTPFGFRSEQGRMRVIAEEDSLAHYEAVVRAVESCGMHQYEVSSYAYPGCESRHNLLYWVGVPYLGVGPGAHSYDGHARWSNPRDVRGYVSTLAQGRLPRVVEELSPEAVFEEYLLTRLRTVWGIDVAEFTRLFGALLRDRLLGRAHPWVERGALRAESGRLHVTRAGFPVLDALILDLSRAWDEWEAANSVSSHCDSSDGSPCGLRPAAALLR